MSHKPLFFYFIFLEKQQQQQSAAEGLVPAYSQYLLIFVSAAAWTLQDIFHVKKKGEGFLQGVQF